MIMFLSFLKCLVPSVLSYHWAPDIISNHYDWRSFPMPALTLPLLMEEEREFTATRFCLCTRLFSMSPLLTISCSSAAP